MIGHNKLSYTFKCVAMSHISFKGITVKRPTYSLKETDLRDTQ